MARAEAEKGLRENPDSAERCHLDYFRLHAEEGEDAIFVKVAEPSNSNQAKNAFHGAKHAANLALVYSLVGEPISTSLIERLLSTPGPVECSDYPRL